MKNYTRKERGITLVALGVTVLILMIISGITISMLTTDHGIIDEATNAQLQTEVSKLQETTDMYVKSRQIQKLKAKDHSETTLESELTASNSITKVETTDGLKLGVFKDFKAVQFQTEFGEGGKSIQENWTGKITDLQDCFAVEFNTNDIYYITNGQIWKASGITTAEQVKEDSEEAGQDKPSTEPTESTKPSPSTEPTTEPSTGPTTPTEDGTRVDISFAYYDASSKSQKIEGKEVVIKKGKSNGTIIPPEVSEIQIEVNGETVTAKPRGWSRSTYAKAEVEIQPGNTLTVTEADNRKTYYMSYEYVETVEYTKPDKTTGTVENKTYVDSNGNTVTEEGKIPTEDSKPPQNLEDEGWNNGKGDGEDQESGGSGVDKDKDIWTTDPDNPDDKSKWVDPTDPDTKVEGQVYPVYTKEITVNRKIYKNQEHDEGPITALMYRSIEEDTIKPATVELGTANNATITQDAKGNELDTEVEAEPRFWTTSEAANIEDTTGNNSDTTKDETEVALNGKAHLTKNTTYYMLYKYTSTVTYGMPKAEGEGEDTEEKQREIYVNANGTIEGQEVQTPDQPTAPSTWLPSADVWQWNGWNKEEMPSDKAVNPDDIVEKEVTLHASFKRDITINFDADGGDANSVPEAITAQSYKNALNEVPAKVTIPEKTPTYGERNFLHWTDKAEEEPQTYEPKQEYEFTEDKTLYAVWDNMGAEVDPNVRPDDPDKVIKYKTVDGVEEEWLPFYNDGTYNYIISKNYINPKTSGVLNSSSGLTYGGFSSYPRGIYWGGNAPSCAGQPQYNNTEDIKTTGFWKRYEFNNTSNNNSKMAYSFLNKDWWTQFKGEYGADAIGTPTLEMFATAYNARYKDKNIAWNASGSTGLNITSSNYGNAGFLDKTDDTFVIEENNQCFRCWLASPCYNGDDLLWAVVCTGCVDNYSYNGDSLGLRPVVKLKIGTKIVDKGEYYELEYTPSETEPVNPNEKPRNPDKIIEYSAGEVEEWLPYYNDGIYNYIIANDYLSTNLKPENASSQFKTDGDYGFKWTAAPNKTYGKIDRFWRKSQYAGTIASANCVAELLDTNEWSKFCGEYGKEAIGSPTLEMFCDAYNSRYKTDDNPTPVNWNVEEKGLNYTGIPGTFDRAFVITETSKNKWCWLASPGFYGGGDGYYSIVNVDYNGNFCWTWYFYTYGLRPVVQLKEGTRIIDKGDHYVLEYNNISTELERPTFKLEPKGWTSDKVTVTINYPEGENVIKEYSYTGDVGDWQTYKDFLTIEDNQMVYAKAIANGRSVISSIEVNNIDKDEPTIDTITEGEITENSIEVKVTADDATSGVGGYQYYLNGDLESDFSKADSHVFRRLNEGQEYTIKVVVTDKAGNTVEQEKIITTKIGEKTIVQPQDLTGDDRNKTLIYKTECEVNEWMPYYNDGIYNYIISAEYIDPQADIGTTKRINSNSMLRFAGNTNNPRGISWGKGGTPSCSGQVQNNNIEDIKTTGFWKRYEYNNTTNINSKIAYTFLNQEWWLQYKGEHGSDAIGTATLEMFATAYKARYPSKSIEWTSNSTNGLEITNSGYSSSGFLDKDDDTFVIAERGQAARCWLASPSYRNSDKHMWVIHLSGLFDIGECGVAEDLGLRPVVRLNKGIKVVKDGNGNLSLDYSEEVK